MQRLSITVVLFLLLIIACSTTSDEMQINYLERAKGNSIQIDPAVLHSSGITPDELIEDLQKADIKTVHLFIVEEWDGSKNDILIDEKYIEALQSNDIGIWIMLLGNCIYGSSMLPSEWEMELLSPYPGGGISFYSFHNEDFVNWQVKRVENIIENYPFILGVEFAESYFPEWKTIDGNGFYGDVSLSAREKFTKKYYTNLEEPLTFQEIKTSSDIYKNWQNFRVEAVVDFNIKMKNAIKSLNPDLLYAAWGMGIRNAEIDEIREHFGLDMLRIAQDVKPDILYIQTSAQDWSDPTLSPEYLHGYNHIVEAIKEINKDIKLGVQADIASLSFHNDTVPKRDGQWWKEYMDLSLSIGYHTNTAYEYVFYKKQGLWIK